MSEIPGPDWVQREALRREQALARDLVDGYQAAITQMDGKLRRVLDTIEQARTAGEPVSPAWLAQQARLQSLLDQAQAEMAAWTRVASGQIRAAQQAEAARAQLDAAALIGHQLGPPPPGVTVRIGDHLNRPAVEHLAGWAGDGGPLGDLLAEIGPAAGAHIREQLNVGLIAGLNPRVTAQRIRGALDGDLARAMTIARTETLRSYREASRATYLANRDVVQGWTWHASLDRRTCPICWSMSGTHHPLDDVMATHPNCRCAPIPDTVSWADLGFPGITDPVDPTPLGVDRFGYLGPADQKAILGPGKFEAFKAGKLRLPDLVGKRTDPRWGPVRYEQSLADALKTAEARTPPVPALPAPRDPHDAFQTIPKSKMGKQVQSALDAITKLHGLPVADEMRGVPVNGKVPRTALGVFRSAGRAMASRGEPVDIGIKAAGGHPGFTFAHEFGHWFDFEDFGDRGRYSTQQPGPVLTDWKAAIHGSHAFQEIATSSPTGYTRYLLDERELFARSYSQWIAIRSGDPNLMAGLNQIRNNTIMRGGYPQQWTDEDFKPIAKAFDDLFRGLGLLA